MPPIVRTTAGAAAILLAAGCSSGPGVRAAPVTTGTPAGSAPAWSARMDGVSTVAAAGDVLVVLEWERLAGVDPATGAERWRRPAPVGSTFAVAGALVVLVPARDGPVEVVDAGTGDTRWRSTGAARAQVRGNAVYLDGCTLAGRGAACTVSARALPDGRPLWTVKDPAFTLLDDTIGAGPPRVTGSPAA